MLFTKSSTYLTSCGRYNAKITMLKNQARVIPEASSPTTPDISSRQQPPSRHTHVYNCSLYRTTLVSESHLSPALVDLNHLSKARQHFSKKPFRHSIHLSKVPSRLKTGGKKHDSTTPFTTHPLNKNTKIPLSNPDKLVKGPSGACSGNCSPCRCDVSYETGQAAGGRLLRQ